MERSGTEVSSAPPTNPAGIRLESSAGGAQQQATQGPPQDRTQRRGRIPAARTVADSPAGSPGGTPTSSPGVAPSPQLERLSSTELSPKGVKAPDHDPPAEKRSWLGLAVLAVACCTVGATVGGALALADHQAAQQQAALAPLLADAAVVVQNVDSAGPRLEPPQLIGLLGQLQTANTAVERVATGRSWLIASSITRRGSLARTSDQAQGLALLADAAGPLRESLTALQNPDAGDPEHLNALARDLNRFASVSLRAQQLGTYPAPTGAAGTPFEVLATAAAVLPTMAGSEAPRFWTVCATADAGCWRFTVQDGRTVGRGTKVTGAGSETVDSETAGSDASDSDAADIVVRGRAPRDLLQNGRLSVTAILNTLVAMDSTDAGADDSAPVVTSSVPVEQHALGVIAKHGAR